MEFKDFIGDAATVFTIAVFLSGIDICYKIWRAKSTVNISAYPFLCGFISCGFWLRYGIIIRDSALMLVNFTGLVLQTSYIAWYWKNNCTESFSLKVVLVSFIQASFYLLTTFCVSDDYARYISGIAASTAGVIFMASPLASLAHVLRTKNAESLPLPMILSTFIMASLWFLYGFLTDDTFVQVPNFLGAVLSFCQLCVYMMYRDKKKYHELTVVA